MKKYAITIVFLITILLSGCQNYTDYIREPVHFPESKWRSSDGSIVFYVDETCFARGTIALKDRDVEVFFTFHVDAPVMSIYPIEMIDTRYWTSGDQYEDMDCDYKSKKHFVATVVHTTFFEVGQEIEFYRVDE